MDLIKFPKRYEQTKKSLSELMSRKQVMEHFGIGKTTLHRWTNVEGILKSFPINGRKFFKLDDVENMIESYYSESNN
jgi:predicted site-specific integrase-resolvase